MAAELNVKPRTVLGKKVAQLRRSGATPANVYGHRIESTSVQADTAHLAHLLRTLGKNQIINLSVEGEGEARTVVIREIARNPLNGRVLHVDFFQVSMTEKMRADVPVVITGTSDAVATYQGVLMQLIDVIHVEALPGDIPAQFEVDVSVLTELEQSIHVRDLHLEGGKVDIHTDPDVVVVRVAAPRLAAEEEEAAAAEGEAPAEGEAAAEGAGEAAGATESSED